MTVAAATEDRRLVVLDGRSAKVRILDQQGRSYGAFGRSGQGPGEFSRPTALGVRGDTIWVADGVLRRVTQFSFSGKVLRTIPIKFPADTGMASGRLSVVGILNDGSLVGPNPMAIGVSADTLPESRRRIYRFDGGRAVDTLMTIRVGHPMLRYSATGVASYQPFDDGDLWQVDPAGSFAIRVERRVAESPRSHSFTITRVFANGRRTRVDIPYEPIAISKALRDSVIGTGFVAFRNNPNRCCDQLTERTVEEKLFLPRYLPPATAIAVAAGGSALIRREATSTSWAHWVVVDSLGRVRKSFQLPAPDRVLAARLPFVWTQGAGPDGETMVKLYRVPE